MASSILDAPTAPRGSQTPSRLWVPEGARSPHADAVIEVGRRAGVGLDPWQEYTLEVSLRRTLTGRWAATTVGVVVSRQNGKNGITEVRELGGLYVLGEQLLVHSAHRFPTSREAFLRLKGLIERTPDLASELKSRGGFATANGNESIELRTGQRIRYLARTKGGGRGFSGDLQVYDEAMDFDDEAHASLLFTTSARPDSQQWYVGSPVDRTKHANGRVLSRLRRRALAGESKSIAWLEWAADLKLDDPTLAARVRERELWATANPALGIRIGWDTVAEELESTDARTFAVERLGVGDWFEDDSEANEAAVISEEVWMALLDRFPVVEGTPGVALDVQPGFKSAAFAACKQRPDGGRHLEIIEHEVGTGWVADRAFQLQERHGLQEILVGQNSPAAALVSAMDARGVRVRVVSGTEYAQACGEFAALAEQGRLRHGGKAGADPALAAAVAGAQIKPSGDAWYWSRSNSTVDISPLVSATLALRGVGSGLSGPLIEVW